MDAWEDNIKRDLREISFEEQYGNHLVYDSYRLNLAKKIKVKLCLHTQ
jgi:hypothetical protein